jgi:hypothetical protein
MYCFKLINTFTFVKQTQKSSINHYVQHFFFLNFIKTPTLYREILYVLKLWEALQAFSKFVESSELRVRQGATVQVPSLPLPGETEGKPQATRGPETLLFIVFMDMRFFV